MNPPSDSGNAALQERPQVSPSPPPAAAPASAAASVTGQLHETTQQLKDGTRDAIESAKRTGADLFTTQKQRLVERLEQYGDAVGAARQSFDRDEVRLLADPADQALHRIERLTRYLRTNDGAQMLRDAGALARRRPEWVFGGLFVAGLAFGRFLKAAAPREPERVDPSGPPPTPRAVAGTPPVVNPPAAAKSSLIIP